MGSTGSPLFPLPRSLLCSFFCTLQNVCLGMRREKFFPSRFFSPQARFEDDLPSFVGIRFTGRCILLLLPSVAVTGAPLRTQSSAWRPLHSFPLYSLMDFSNDG